MTDLIERLRALARCEHSDVSVAEEAAAAHEAARAEAERLAFLAREPVIEEINGVKKSIYDYAAMIAEENGRDEPNYEDYTNGMRRLIDAAIERERRSE